MTSVAAVGADQWREVRDVRLAALRDAPVAFASRYDDEVGLTEADWRQRAATAGWFLARDDAGSPVGIAVGFRDPAEPGHRRELVSMWVAPSARGQGIAVDLVDLVADWARADGATELGLWVVDGNAAATRAYQRVGFVPTGDRKPVVPGDPRVETRMLLAL